MMAIDLRLTVDTPARCGGWEEQVQVSHEVRQSRCGQLRDLG